MPRAAVPAHAPGDQGPGTVGHPVGLPHGDHPVPRLTLPVEDKTGAAGNYEVALRFAREDDPESTLPSIFTALQEEMGIKLVLAKVPVEMVVIDHLERRPTEN